MSKVPLCTSKTQTQCIPPSSIQVDVHQTQALGKAVSPQARKELEGLLGSSAYKNLKNEDKIDLLGFFKKFGAESGRTKAISQLLQSGELTRIEPYYRKFIYANIGKASGKQAAELANTYHTILGDPPFSRASMLEKTALLSNPSKGAALTMNNLVRDKKRHFPRTEAEVKAGVKKYLKEMAAVWADDADLKGAARERAIRKKYAASKGMIDDLVKQWRVAMNRWYDRAGSPTNGDTVGQRVSNYLNSYSWQHSLLKLWQGFGHGTYHRTVKANPCNYPY